MIFRQFLHASPIGASYLVGCGGQGQCVVVDPMVTDIPARPENAGQIREANLNAIRCPAVVRK
jgi:hypothetical protein